MILTLLITIVVEGVVVVAFCLRQKRPLLPIFLSSLAANVITQSLLWIVLGLFFQDYLAALLVSEVLIWLAEGFLIGLLPLNQLSIRSALLLSLGMNLASFAIGWFLPV